MSEQLTIEKQIEFVRPNRAYRRLHRDCLHCNGDGYIVDDKKTFVEVCTKYKKINKNKK